MISHSRSEGFGDTGFHQGGQDPAALFSPPLAFSRAAEETDLDFVWGIAFPSRQKEPALAPPPELQAGSKARAHCLCPNRPHCPDFLVGVWLGGEGSNKARADGPFGPLVSPWLFQVLGLPC